MKKRIILILLVILLVIPQHVYASNRQVAVTLPTFTVTLNGLQFDNTYAQFPLLVYRDITYFPMTYYKANLLNLYSNWTAENGLVIAKDDPERAKPFVRDATVSNRNSRTQTARVVDAPVTVNGTVIDNLNEPFPLLIFRDVTYFPLTWRFAVDEFGWHYTFCSEAGLDIRADNFFYIGEIFVPYGDEAAMFLGPQKHILLEAI